MCGIAGIYAYHRAALGADREELRIIRDHMIARGPDGKAEWLSHDRRVALAHCRLAIIDLSEQAGQPMASADGSLIITFNGEIYNYRVLKQLLESKGYNFRTNSDTEVLLHLYAEKGDAMLHDLRGMFAFAIWDQNKRALLLARDPYGIKPLYYADDGRSLRFASQVKALLAGGKISRDREPAGIVGFYLFGSVPEPFTLYQKVRSVPAGNFVWIDDIGAREPVSYFSLGRVWTDAESLRVSDGTDIHAEVRDALLDSVKHHMVADVPVGAFLSGGIDSGSLVGLMTESLSEVAASSNVAITRAITPLNTITLRFAEFNGKPEDESLQATQVANFYGTRQNLRVVDQAEFNSDLPHIFEAMDQPSIDGVNVWFVSKAAREVGLKVAVSGLGGDELFGGYPSFRDIPRWTRQLWLPSRIPGLGWLAEHIHKLFEPLFTAFNPKAGSVLRYSRHYAAAYLLRRGLFLPGDLIRLLDREVMQDGLKRLQTIRNIESVMAPQGASAYGRVASLEGGFYMRNQLLRDTDWASMNHSLEVRVPLVDTWLLRRLAPLLLAGGNKNHKYLLASSPKPPLPTNVISRPKSCFTIPMETWMPENPAALSVRQKALVERRSSPWARRWSVIVANIFGIIER